LFFLFQFGEITEVGFEVINGHFFWDCLFLHSLLLREGSLLLSVVAIFLMGLGFVLVILSLWSSSHLLHHLRVEGGHHGVSLLHHHHHHHHLVKVIRLKLVVAELPGP